MRTRSKRRASDDSPFLIEHEMNAYFALILKKCSTQDIRKVVDRIMFKKCPQIIYMKPPVGVDMTGLMFGRRYKGGQSNYNNCLISKKTFKNDLTKDEAILIVKQLYNMVAGVSYFDADGEEIPEEKRQEFIAINNIKLVFSCFDYKVKKSVQKVIKDAFTNLEFTHNSLITKEIKKDFTNIFNANFGGHSSHGQCVYVFINPLDEMPEHTALNNDSYSLDDSIFGKYHKSVCFNVIDELIDEIEFRKLFDGLFISGESGIKYVVENIRGTPGDVFITGDPETCEEKHKVDVTGAVNITFSWNKNLISTVFRNHHLFNDYGYSYNGSFIGIPADTTTYPNKSITLPSRKYSPSDHYSYSGPW